MIKNIKELGDIVFECNKSLSNLTKILLQGEKYVLSLISSLQEYEQVSFNSNSLAANSSNGTYSYSQGNNNSMTDEQRAAMVKLTGQNWSDNLPQSEKNAVRDYTGTYHLNINRVLRDIEDHYDEGNEERVISIHNALVNAHIPCDCTVYRGASIQALGAYQNYSDEQLIGLTIIDYGFMSTSINPNDAFSGDIRLELSVPEGANGAYVGYISHCNHYESEVLFDAGQRMQITGVRRDMFGNRTICARILV